MNWEDLVSAAAAAREAAYAPYSQFKVGAALRMEDGSLHAGCNVENRSFGVTVCAERVALAAAVTAGNRKPAALAVVTDVHPPAIPCGVCLQTLAEFADPELPILLSTPGGDRREFRLQDLLPYPFVFPEDPR